MDIRSSNSQSTATQAPSRGALNPISSKVTTVLSTSYADSEFRDALALLDERKVKNNPKTRRQLRSYLQQDAIKSNGAIIDEFGRVADQLRRIQSALEGLNQTYGDMRGRMTTAHKQTEPIVGEAASLMRQRADVAAEQQLLLSFKKHFVLADDEIAALTSTGEPVDDAFFNALSKTKTISKDCEILLGFEKQTLGLEIMEQASKNTNLAFQKLYKWVQKEFKTLNLENPQLNPSIRRAIRVLAERPSLFQSCLDFFAEARQRTLSDSFHLGLTGTSTTGEPDNSVKPIEMAAHDPLRYAGDMLAWIHSATVGEREALEVLFLSEGDEIAKGLQSGRANDIWQYIGDEGEAEVVSEEFDALRALNDLVDRDVSAAARILRQRLDQVIRSNEDITLAYRLAVLLGFYRFTFTKLLGEDAGLLEIMTNLESESLRQFRSLVRDYIAALQGEFQHTPADLAPPDFFLNALKQLRAIMQTFETSLSSSPDREAEFQPVLSETFEPFMKGSERMSESIDPVKGTVFIINCYLAAISTLKPFDFAQKRAQELQERVDEEAEKLSASQYRFLREASGLGDMFVELNEVTLDKKDLTESLGALQSMQPEALGQASQTLDDFLPSALMDAMDNVKHVQDARLAREVTEKAADRFCRDFEHVEGLLMAADDQRETTGDDEGSEGSLRALFPRTTGEIRVLLS